MSDPMERISRLPNIHSINWILSMRAESCRIGPPGDESERMNQFALNSFARPAIRPLANASAH